MTSQHTSPSVSRPGIPTTYNGVRFRSRLEARWAAFFDHIRWRWEYEPLDLQGYIPDFVLQFPLAPVLVEVKPALTMACFDSAKRKIWDSGWPGEALCLGASYSIGEWPGDPKPGLFLARMRTDRPFWDQAQLYRCPACDHISVSPSGAVGNRDYICRQCGGQGEDNKYGPPMFLTWWKMAGNEVQWRGR